MNDLNRYFSGVVVNQNATASDSLTLASEYVQEFRLPSDFARAGQFPALTGFQLFVTTTDAEAEITWTMERKPFLGDWSLLTSGTATGSVVGDEIWMTCLFEEPVQLNIDNLEDRYRFSFEVVSGVTEAWYTVPNPLRSEAKAYAADGTTPLLDTGAEYSFMFRVLGAVADSGTDFLGNRYRSVAVKSSPGNTRPEADSDVSWLSGPQPSEFAVVSLYIDERNPFGDASVIDHVLIDPLTPDIWFHIYYTSDGEPGTTEEEWEERLWTPVPRAFHARRREEHAFPEPITAKYLKIEFSHLQPRHYSPGSLQRPISYKKHPKWVLDYFLLATERARDLAETRFISASKAVTYDAYDLAFRYYRDDLQSEPDGPAFVTPEDKSRLTQFLSSRDDFSDLVDPDTRQRINTFFSPYLKEPRLQNLAKSLLGELTFRDLAQVNTYPVETLPPTSSVGTAVSSSNREAVVFEQTFPVMFFYLTCRHRYREVTASLSYDRAYFAGIKTIQFSRERYSVESDATLYVETLGDYANAERNDFLSR